VAVKVVPGCFTVVRPGCPTREVVGEFDDLGGDPVLPWGMVVVAMGWL
jgi:hypothetical protein